MKSPLSNPALSSAIEVLVRSIAAPRCPTLMTVGVSMFVLAHRVVENSFTNEKVVHMKQKPRGMEYYHDAHRNLRNLYRVRYEYGSLYTWEDSRSPCAPCMCPVAKSELGSHRYNL